MTREELTKAILQMGFELIESTDKCDIFKNSNQTEVTVYEYEMKTKWYIGTELQERMSVHRTMTWKNRRYNSRAFQWNQIEEFKKQIEDDAKDQPVDDKGIRQRGILSHETEGSLRSEDS